DLLAGSSGGASLTLRLHATDGRERMAFVGAIGAVRGERVYHLVQQPTAFRAAVSRTGAGSYASHRAGSGRPRSAGDRGRRGRDLGRRISGALGWDRDARGGVLVFLADPQGTSQGLFLRRRNAAVHCRMDDMDAYA